MVPFPEDYLLQEAQQFARSLLEGEVFPALRPLRPWLTMNPALLTQQLQSQLSSVAAMHLRSTMPTMDAGLLRSLAEVRPPAGGNGKSGQSGNTPGLLQQPLIREFRALLETAVIGPKEAGRLVTALAAAELWFRELKAAGAVSAAGAPRRLLSRAGLVWMWSKEPQFLLAELGEWLVRAHRPKLEKMWPLRDEGPEAPEDARKQKSDSWRVAIGRGDSDESDEMVDDGEDEDVGGADKAQEQLRFAMDF